MKIVELILIFALAIPVFAQVQKLAKEDIANHNDAKLFVQQNRNEIAGIIVKLFGSQIGRIRNVTDVGEMGGGTGGGGGSGPSFGYVTYPFEFRSENGHICTAHVSVINGHSQRLNGIDGIRLECIKDGRALSLDVDHSALGNLAPSRDIFMPAGTKPQDPKQ